MGKQQSRVDVIDKLSDPKYFIESLLWIVDKNSQKVPFLLNRPQAIYYQNRSSWDLILKARQEGFSSYIEAEWLHATLFQPNTRAVTISHEKESTKRHFDRVRFFKDNMASKSVKVEIELQDDNQMEIFVPKINSRYWIGTAGSRAFGRGDMITHLHLSEVAHYADQSILTASMEACTPNARRVMETTANGVGELFYKLWMDSKNVELALPWRRHFFAWFDNPEYRVERPDTRHIPLTPLEEQIKRQHGLSLEQILWRRKKIAEMVDPSLFPQEYPANDIEAFLSSGAHVFNLQKLEERRQKCSAPEFICELYDDGREVVRREAQDGRFRIWKVPREGRKYLISADTSEGVPGGDWSVAQVLDRESWEQVAVWRGRINPGRFGDELNKMGVFYNNAILIPELNNHGWATVERLRELKYPHIFKTSDIRTDQWRDKKEQFGFPQNAQTRNHIITAGRNAVDQDTIKFNDETTVMEFMTFVKDPNTGREEAQDGCFDDCVISLCIGAYALKFLYLDETYAERHRIQAHQFGRGRDALGYDRREQGRRSATGYRSWR